MSAKNKLIISAVIFAIGAYLITKNMFSALSFEWVLGVILVVIASPISYFFYAKYKSDYHQPSDEEIINQAKANVINKGE